MILFAAALAAQVPEDQLGRAVQLHQAGNLKAARHAYEVVLEADPENSVAHSNLGAIYAHEGHYQDAIDQYRLALSKDGENPGIRFNLALAYYDSAQIVKAAGEFARVMAAQPDNYRSALLLADCYLRMGENKKVIELLASRETAHLDDRAMLYVLGTALIRDNQFDEGQKLIDRILRNGDSSEAHVMLGTARMMGQDYKNAAQEFARAIELNPKLPLAHRLYARVLLVESNVPQAMEAFRGELAVDPNDYDSNLMIAVLLKQEKKYDEALKYLKHALEIRPEAPDARYQLGSLYVSTGDLAEAQRILEELLKEAPDFVEAHVSLATVYYRRKRKQDGDHEQEIVRKLSAEISARPGGEAAARVIKPAESKETFEVLSQRADTARESNRTDEAIDLYQRALELKSDWAEGWWYLATLFYENDRYAVARPAFASLVELKPKGGPAWAMLGLCEFQLTDYAQALNHLERGRALGIARNTHLSLVVRYHLAVLLNHFNQPESALQLLYSLARQEEESPAMVQAMGLSALGLRYLPQELPAEKQDLVMRVGHAEFVTARRNAAQAHKEFDEVVARYPEAPGVHYSFGVFLLGSDSDAALTEFQKELEISPAHINARLQIAFEYIKRKNCAAGLPYAEKAVKLDPRSFAARNALGRILLELGQTPRAIQELETGMKLAPDSPETCYALARAYTRAGRKQEANRARAEFNRLDRLRRSLLEGQAAGSPAPDAKAPPPG